MVNVTSSAKVQLEKVLKEKQDFKAIRVYIAGFG